MHRDPGNCRLLLGEAQVQSRSQPRACFHYDLGDLQQSFGNLLETSSDRVALQSQVIEAHGKFDLSRRHIGRSHLGAALVLPRGNYHRIIAALDGPVDSGEESEGRLPAFVP